ncbi:MAG: pyridoxal phosphate-dependent aminotransferase [Lachnospiraceae bacterium]|jgi:cystathionine beta-lyase|nr:pyridoxal phosphate-dependent aminotransferase [Lachnospiraceae bacterium]
MGTDFDAVIDRRGTNSLKVDFAKERGKPDGLLPMWVADMDFPAPPEVLEDLKRMISHGIFGYTEVKQAYYDALSNWFITYFQYSFEKREVIKTPGVVFALAMAVRAFTKLGASVMIQTPVYYPFYEIIRDNGRKIVENPLVYAGGTYTIDFEDFEHKIKENAVTIFLLCSPHNPVGRVWTLEELTRIRDICDQYGVLVFSDEIHCDFVWEGFHHTCFGTISPDCIVATAPSKTFNLAGLQVANIIVKNPKTRHKLEEEIRKSGYSQLNGVGLAACQSAYTHGRAWLLELKEYIQQNRSLVESFLTEHLPKVHLTTLEGTYLIWLDFSAYELEQKVLDEKIVNGAHLWLDSGTMFGQGGLGFQRMNIACPRTTLLTALKQLVEGFG